MENSFLKRFDPGSEIIDHFRKSDAGILKFGVDRVEFFRTGKGPLCLKEKARFVVVVKKTFRYSNVFFYNPLCRNSAIRNIIMKSGM